MPNTFVRPASAEDLKILTEVAEFGDLRPESVTAGECSIAGIDDAPLAYGIFNRSFFGRPYVEFIYIRKDRRGEGLGNSLLNHFETECEERRIWTSTNLSNQPMVQMLNKRGYRLSGVIENLIKVPTLIYYRDLLNH